MADGPGLAARQAQAGDVAQHGRAQQQLAGPREGRLAHLAARDQLLHAELVGALEHDGGRHGDHDAWPIVSGSLSHNPFVGVFGRGVVR